MAISSDRLLVAAVLAVALAVLNLSQTLSRQPRAGAWADVGRNGCALLVVVLLIQTLFR